MTSQVTRGEGEWSLRPASILAPTPRTPQPPSGREPPALSTVFCIFKFLFLTPLSSSCGSAHSFLSTPPGSRDTFQEAHFLGHTDVQDLVPRDFPLSGEQGRGPTDALQDLGVAVSAPEPHCPTWSSSVELLCLGL